MHTETIHPVETMPSGRWSPIRVGGNGVIEESPRVEEYRVEDAASLKRIAVSPIDIAAYTPFMDETVVSDLDRLAARLRGLKIVHVNATPKGGGVAELLRSVVPLGSSLGLDTSWYCLSADPSFFEMTKNIHNGLQGGEWQFDKSARKSFQEYTRRFSREIVRLDADVCIIHDPQPCAMVGALGGTPCAMWHCHIDTSHANPCVWRDIMRYAQGYDQLIFCHPEYVNGSLHHERVTFLQPAIDPLSAKNHPLDPEDARHILNTLGIDTKRPIVTQVSRFDPWKDPHGVIDAYRIAKRRVPDLQLALVGVMAAQDDPEAERVYTHMETYRQQDGDVHLFTDPRQVGDPEINAFQTASDVILQKSLREGFGLTVAEAMWKGTPVIGGNCGGIRLQIHHGSNGFLVDSVQECADRIVNLLNDQDIRIRLGNAGRETVRRNFLIPRLLRDYLQVADRVMSATKM